MTPGEFDDAIACYHIIRHGAKEAEVQGFDDDGWCEEIP